MAETFDVKMQLKFDRGARAAANQAILEAVTEVFEQDIKPEAVALSPYKTGHNARSIDTEVQVDPKTGFIVAKLFTQSGYGGYLELGFRVKLRALASKALAWASYRPAETAVHGRPYLYPAFQKFSDKIGQLCARRINQVRTMVRGAQ